MLQVDTNNLVWVEFFQLGYPLCDVAQPLFFQLLKYRYWHVHLHTYVATEP